MSRMTRPSTATPPADAQPNVEGAAKPRILIVDDEPSMREMLRIVLRRDGYDVMVAANGTAGDRHPAARASRSAAVRHPDAGHQRRRRAARGQGGEPRPRRVHDDGVCVDRHRRRSHAARRRRLLHQAVQHGRAAPEGAAAPRDAPDEAGERPAEARAQHVARVLQHHRPQRRDARAVQDDRDHRQDQQHGADHRRVGHRQGPRRARRPLQLAAARSPVRGAELRRRARDAARVGALRPHARRVHRRRHRTRRGWSKSPSAAPSSSTRSAR